MDDDRDDEDQARWWAEVGQWGALRKEWEESGSDLDFEEWAEQHESAL